MKELPEESGYLCAWRGDKTQFFACTGHLVKAPQTWKVLEFCPDQK